MKELSEEWKEIVLTDKFELVNPEEDAIKHCLFRSISDVLRRGGIKTTHETLRRQVIDLVNEMTDEEFFELLQNYKVKRVHGEFKGGWNPFLIKTRKDFIRVLKKNGFIHEGDLITINLISKVTMIDFFILDEHTKSLQHHPYEKNDKIIVLLLSPDGFFSLVGIKGEKTHIYDKSDLPDELDRIIDKDEFTLNHIKLAYEKLAYEQGKPDTEITIESLIIEMEHRLHFKFSDKDYKRLSSLLSKWLLFILDQ